MFHMSNNSMNDRIAIIEGSSMRRGFNRLSFPVPFAAFPQIFRGPDDSEPTETFPLSEVITKQFSFVDRLRSVDAEVCFIRVKLNSGSN